MDIAVAKTAGFCFGVKRALEIVTRALQENDTPIYCLGPLIHNPAVVAELEAKGLKQIDDIDTIHQGRVVIRSHGVGPSVFRKAAEKQLEVIDATCPFVKNVQELAMMLFQEGYQVVIVGEKDHAEVLGVLDAISGEALVVDDPDEVETARLGLKVGVVSQTTKEMHGFERTVGSIVPHTKECRIFNTICLATVKRQQEAAELSLKVDLMIVVGGKNSANTRHLAEICRDNGVLVHQVETAGDLQPEWFVHGMRVGITAGASTPDEQILSVVAKINLLGGNRVVIDETEKQNVVAEKQAEESGEEEFTYDWPDDRFKELVPGQIIEAKVILVRDDAAFVDIGGKSDLTIPLDELTAEPLTSAKEAVKVGDVIKVVVRRSGDEDKIKLSKRLYDLEKVWLDLDPIITAGSPIEAYGSEVIKGGLSVKVKGLKAFMPASQSGLGRGNLEELVGQTFSVRIIEADRSKHRLLVSRRALLEAEKKQAEEKFFSTATEGERRVGKVSRIVDFGAFIDLGGGVEGLLHVSEMSWTRVKSPRDILKEGDEVEVMITKIDPEAKKISLSLKQIQAHPWDQKIKEFSENGIYSGTVVKLENFGAFVSLAPGLDGLVHISQISEKHVNKPEEVVQVGETVKVKILKIDMEHRRISLSMKQIASDQDAQEVKEFINGQDTASVGQSLGDLLKK